MAIDAFVRRPSSLHGIFVKLRDAIEQPTDRTVLAALFASLFFLNYVAHLFDLAAGERLIFSSSRTVSGAELIGFVAIAVVLKDLAADRVLRWWDFATIAGIAIFLIHPWRSNAALAVSLLGLMFIGRGDKRLKSLGQLCLGLAWIDLWGPVVMGLIGQWLLPIETELAHIPLWLFGSFSVVGNVIFGQNGHDILVLEPCSAFRNTINMAFIWLAMMKILRLDFHLWNFLILVLGLIVVVLINTARIGLMAFSFDQYVFWHLGPGLSIVKFTMLTIVLGLFYFGLRAKPRHPT
jgi:hypothetical protein